MTTLGAATILLALAAAAFVAGRRRALAFARHPGVRLHSRPVYHGAFVALACALPGLGGLALSPWLGLSAGSALGVLAWTRGAPGFRARPAVEAVLRALFAACSMLAILVTIGIVLSLVFEAGRFFERVSPMEFLFGLQWSPQTAIRADQVGSSGAFGAVPVLAGTLLITAIAMGVAVPIGLLSAIYLSEYAGPRARATLKPTLEILAGIPTVVYGFFAALSVGPLIRALGERLGIGVASESALAAGLVMGVMIIPFVSSLSDDVINAVPSSLREASLGLGATPSETIRRVVLPAALPGIVGAVLLALSRAIGETMIVVMAAGLAANLTLNPLEAVTTVTVQIVTLLVGDQEFDSAKTLAAFALGLLLFMITLVLNVIALRVVRRYREQYE
jgi:phosphate transport system permease protein